MWSAFQPSGRTLSVGTSLLCLLLSSDLAVELLALVPLSLFTLFEFASEFVLFLSASAESCLLLSVLAGLLFELSVLLSTLPVEESVDCPVVPASLSVVLLSASWLTVPFDLESSLEVADELLPLSVFTDESACLVSSPLVTGDSLFVGLATTVCLAMSELAVVLSAWTANPLIPAKAKKIVAATTHVLPDL